ncbi:MAG: mannose-1-phosphate guanylyltransferase [Planctomycetes bacterium]|nr:mannose-1-phosphate guanylyltransferase [Planctomycetota bacterium]
MNLHAVIMAGGSGTRFWPASRQDRPKQLLPLAPGGKTLIEATVDRLAPLVDPEHLWIVTNPTQVDRLKSIMESFDESQVIVEPEPRDTAACIGLSVAKLEAADPNAVVAIVPSDHVITPTERFVDLLRRGAEVASDGRTIVLFGVKPTRPATGFGYIEPGAPIEGAPEGAREILRFREKPNLDTAREFVTSGRFLWNSGIFLMTAQALLTAMDVGSPALAKATRAMIDASRTGDQAAVQAAFCSAPRMSVDYAVMEKAPHAAVIEADLSWSDLGSFLALDTIATPDKQGNVCRLMDGAEATMLDARDCVVYAEGERTVALLGTHDLVCVAVDDAVLVCPKHRIDDMKSLVQKLRDERRENLL